MLTSTSTDPQALAVVQLAPKMFDLARRSSGYAAIVFQYIREHKLYTSEGYKTMRKYAQAVLKIGTETYYKKAARAGGAVWEYLPKQCEEFIARVGQGDHWSDPSLPPTPNLSVLALLPAAMRRKPEDERKELLGRLESGEVTAKELQASPRANHSRPASDTQDQPHETAGAPAAVTKKEGETASGRLPKVPRKIRSKTGPSAGIPPKPRPSERKRPVASPSFVFDDEKPYGVGLTFKLLPYIVPAPMRQKRIGAPDPDLALACLMQAERLFQLHWTSTRGVRGKLVAVGDHPHTEKLVALLATRSTSRQRARAVQAWLEEAKEIGERQSSRVEKRLRPAKVASTRGRSARGRTSRTR
jgi:hypothetical protein